MEEVKMSEENGSTAPAIKAVTKDELWQQVLARRSAHTADIQENVQALAAKEVSGPKLTEPAAAELVAELTDGVAVQQQDATVDSIGNTAGIGAAFAEAEDGGDRVDGEIGGANQVSELKHGASGGMVPTGSGMAMGTANPAYGGMDQFVHAYQVKRLNPKRLPDPPKGDSAQLKATLANVYYLIEAYGVVVVYDEVKKKLFIGVPGHVGSADNQDNVALAYVHSLATLNGMATGQIGNQLLVIGDRNRINPVKEWIQRRPWDGMDRFEELAKTIQERKGYPPAMKKILLRKWLRSLVAAGLMVQGFRCRGVLVLQGPQSIGKGAWFQALVPDAVLSELVILLGHNLDPANKDSVTKAISHWIVELGELDSTFKKDIARVKGFLTSGSDKIRRPYGRLESEYPRRTVFCASVNDTCFLVDETGNSRFWTIAVESINYQHGIDMQQLFAQIAVEFHAGEQWWLTQDEEMQLALVNSDHRVVSMVRERLMAAINADAPVDAKTEAMSAIDMLKEAGIDRPTNPQCKECASILRELYGDAKKVQGRYVWRVALADRDQLTVAKSPPIVDAANLY